MRSRQTDPPAPSLPLSLSHHSCTAHAHTHVSPGGLRRTPLGAAASAHYSLHVYRGNFTGPSDTGYAVVHTAGHVAVHTAGLVIPCRAVACAPPRVTRTAPACYILSSLFHSPLNKQPRSSAKQRGRRHAPRGARRHALHAWPRRAGGTHGKNSQVRDSILLPLFDAEGLSRLLCNHRGESEGEGKRELRGRGRGRRGACLQAGGVGRLAERDCGRTAAIAPCDPRARSPAPRARFQRYQGPDPE